MTGPVFQSSDGKQLLYLFVFKRNYAYGHGRVSGWARAFGELPCLTRHATCCIEVTPSANVDDNACKAVQIQPRLQAASRFHNRATKRRIGHLHLVALLPELAGVATVKTGLTAAKTL